MAITKKTVEVFVTSRGTEHRSLSDAQFWEFEGQLGLLLCSAGLKLELAYTGADVARIMLQQPQQWRADVAKILLDCSASP